nr:helix-turn-helix transcriptional regulator [uncultured Actinoplanes sp.]
MMGDPAVDSSFDDSLGSILARLRHEAGLTGHQLGRRVGMSQAKISRLENGVGIPAVVDVRRIAQELGAPPALIERLVELTESAGDQMTDWRPARGVVASLQREVEQLEAGTRSYRVFQPAVVVGLAQTNEYMRAILGATHGIRSVSEAISVRVRRQEALSDPNRQFHFVMTETVLRNRVCKPQYMPAQLQRLRDLAALPNVSVRLIRSDADLTIPPYHGFELLDDRIVIVDVFNTLVTTRGRSDVALYAEVFERLEDNATEDIDPILDHYLDEYLDLARSGRRKMARG